MRKKILVYSDVSGHYRALLDNMEKHGVSKHYIPDDIHLVFNGDIIHRGPDSLKLLQMIDELIEDYPENVSLTLGNHESNYHVNARAKFSGYYIPDEALKILHRWFDHDVFKIAVGSRSHLGDLLITHAGLTYGFYQKIGSPQTIQDTVKTLNSLSWDRNSIVWNSGEMIDDFNPVAGPLWASDAGELLPGWHNVVANGATIPFGQIHGHSSVYDWERKSFRTTNVFITGIHVDTKRRHTTSIIGNQLFVGSDPDHTRIPATTWEPYVIEDSRVFIL